MKLQQRINAFCKLGDRLRAAIPDNNNPDEFLQDAIHQAILTNPWFTEDTVKESLLSHAGLLTRPALENWLQSYPALEEKWKARTIGVITAGNVPLVGFHDFLCVLVSGNSFLGKLSSKDDSLLKALDKLLIEIEPEFRDTVFFTDTLLKDYDAVIATGSNNSARHFEYYFRQVPHLIRRNRNGIAILDGSETKTELELLARDIFLYYGLGCRNVSKIYIPEKYDIEFFLSSLESWHPVINHHHYANNYEYNRAIFLVNMVPHFDNGFLLFREERSIASPIAVLHYEKYSSKESLAAELSNQSEQIQCIVSMHWPYQTAVPFGKAQYPGLHDYADGIDTMNFLENLE